VYDIRPLNETEKANVRPALIRLNDEEQQRLLDQLHRIEWKGTTTETADEVLSRRQPGAPKDTERAAEWLREYLAAEPIESDTCVAVGNKALSLSRSGTWWRACVLKPLLGGKSRKDGFDTDSHWYFTLPSHEWPPPPKPGDAAEAKALHDSLQNGPPDEEDEEDEEKGTHEEVSREADPSGTTNPSQTSAPYPFPSSDSSHSSYSSASPSPPAQPSLGVVQSPSTEPPNTVEGSTSPAPDAPSPAPTASPSLPLVPPPIPPGETDTERF
jgi:hypothetical protein